MGFGWSNPLPFSLGGGPTDIEEIWRALRSAEGGEHGPGPEGGDEDGARIVQATAIAGAERAIERSFFQAFPGLATDALPIWEEALRSDGADSDVALRTLLELSWRAPDGATTPHLQQALLDISAQLTIQIEDVDDTDVTIPGKHVAPEDNVPDYGGGSAALFPNYASRDVLRVLYVLDGAEVAIPENISRDVTKLLQRRLPSTQTWTLVQVVDPDAPEFLLDGGDHGESLLDVTPMG
jgi:hypothetical protein